jgi:hypothetical protein
MANPWDNDPEITAGPWDKDPEVAQGGFLDRAFGNPLRHGAADTLKGDAETAKVLGAPNVAKTLDELSQGVAPQGYQPAGPDAKKAWDEGKYLDWASLIPRRALESLPQLGQAGAGAAVGSFLGPLGTRIGWTAGYGASTLGRNVEDSARNRAAGDTTANPGTEDFVRGALSSAAEAYLAGKGASAATGGVIKAGASTLPAAAAAVGKGALSDAAANVATTAVHKGLIDPNGDANVGDLAEAAGTGALTGAALRSTKLPTDIAVLNRNKNISPEAGGRVADRLYATGEDLGTPAGDKAAFEKALDDLKTQRTSNKPTGQDNATNEVMNRVSSDLDKGRAPAEADVATLKSTFGPDDKFVNAIEDHSTLNQVRGQAVDVNGGLTGGLQGSPIGSYLNPKAKLAKLGDVGGVIAHLTGTHLTIPALASSLGGFDPIVGVGIHGGLWSGMKGIDALTGKNRPVSQFAERYRTDTPFDPSQLSSFNDQNAIANDKLKNLGKTAAIMQRSEALAQKQADVPLAQAKRTSQLMTNSDALEAKQRNEALKSPAFTSKMMTADAANQAKAQALLEKTVKDAEAAKQRNVNQALGNAKQTATIMRNSEQGPTSDARVALAVAKFKQQIEAQTAAAAEKQKSQQYADIRQTAGIMRNSDPAKTSAGDATMPLRVARLKQQLAAQAERDSADAIKQQVSEKRTKQREETKAGLKSLLQGDNAEAQFQARVAELGAKRKQQAQQPQPAAQKADPRQRIEDAYTAATGGKYGEMVGLDKIRAALPDLDKATVDGALKQILGSESEKATLQRNDDTRRITPAQKDAAFNPAGEPFHTLAISGPKVMPPHPTMRVEEGGHTVDRTTAGVLKAARYAESIRGRMQAKNDAIEASIAENPSHATALTSLLTELHTGNARSRNGAEAVVQRHLQNLPPEVQASVRKHLTEKFWNAWRKVND